MKKFDKDRLILGFAGPALALVVAFALSTLVLLISNRDPFELYRLLFEQVSYSDVQVLIINQAGTYYLAALAVAVGFRMNGERAPSGCFSGNMFSRRPADAGREPS